MLAGTRAAVIFRGHLSQQPVPQSEWRIAETGQLAALQKFGIHHGPCDHYLRATWTHSGEFFAFADRETCQHFGDPLHLGSWHCARSHTLRLVEAMANGGQGSSR